MTERYFKGDKWNRELGFAIPYGAKVEVIKFFARRRVQVRYRGELYGTMLWCLCKTPLKAGA